MSEERSDNVERLVRCHHSWKFLSEENSRFAHTEYDWCEKCGKLRKTTWPSGERKYYTPNAKGDLRLPRKDEK